MASAPVPHLLAAFGKDSNLYLLNRDNLGGIGGELSKTTVSNGAGLNGASAVYTTSKGTFIAFHTAVGSRPAMCPTQGAGNLGVAKVLPNTPPRVTVVWCTAEQNLGSPIVTTTDGSSNAIVWDANDALWAYDGETGAKLLTGTNTVLSTPMQYFNSPINVPGRIAVAVNSRLYVFKP
jgi:hypothetical protein